MYVITYMTTQYDKKLERYGTKRFKNHTDKERDRNVFFVDYLKCVTTDILPLYVCSVGHDRSWPGKYLNRDFDERLMFHYVVNGSLNFGNHRVTAGQYFFCLPRQKHTIRFDDPELDMYYMTLGGSNILNIIQDCALDKINGIQDCPFLEEIIPLFEKMIYEVPRKGDLPLYVIGIMYQILSHQYYHCRKINSIEKTKNYADQYLQRATMIISKKYMQNITVQDIADEINISVGYLGNIFRSKLGISPMSMITQKRMELAKTILDSSSKARYSDVALMCGYNDYAYFSKSFKKYFGMSPNVYMEKKFKK